MSYIGKIKIGNSGTELPIGSTLYGVATAPATGTVMYTANSGNLANADVLIEGLTVHIKFAASNTYTNPTLKVGSFDAKPIHRTAGTAVGKTEITSWPAGAVVSLTYDGTAWVINSSTDINTDTTYTIATGTANGKIKVTPSVGNAYEVSVYGLGSAAYTDSSAYAVSNHNHNDVYAPKNNPTFTGTVIVPAISSNNGDNEAVNKKYVDDAISDVLGTANAMVFKGTIGAQTSSPTITSLPTSDYQSGWTYKVITAGNYGTAQSPLTCEQGDLIIAIHDGPSTGSSVVPADWTIAQGNIDSSLYKGSNSFTDGHILVADGTNGQVKDGGAKATSISAGSTSTNVPTSAAVASFVEGKGYVTSSGVTQVAAGIGLTTTSGSAITSTGTVKAKLKSETALTNDSTAASETSNRNYAIVTDHSGYLAVTVPWTDTNTKVTQEGVTTNEEYAILLKKTTGVSDETETVKFGKTTGKLVTVNPSTGIITAAGFSGALAASDVISALGTDNTVTTALTFLHKSGAWKTLSISSKTIASINNGVLTLASTAADDTTLGMS